MTPITFIVKCEQLDGTEVFLNFSKITHMTVVSTAKDAPQTVIHFDSGLGQVSVREHPLHIFASMCPEAVMNMKAHDALMNKKPTRRAPKESDN